MELPECFSEGIERLHEQAMAATGLANFGDPTYLEGLRVLLESYDETAHFGDTGRFSTWAMAVNCLRGRLYAIDGLKKHPACRETPIEKPLFIVGLPRTGTTILHRLLASRVGNQGLEYWLGSYPQPRPPRSNWQDEERFKEVEQSLRMLNEISPELKKIHEMRAERVDECRLLFMQSFANVTFQASASVPGYEQWLYRADMRDAYNLYAQTLQLIGMNDGGKRWILKDPSHLWALDVLLETFPDATIIQTHRDPVKLIPSVSNLVLTTRRMQEPEITPEQIGSSQLSQWDIVLSRGMAVRKRHPDRFIDMYFDEFVRDPVAAVLDIYRQLGESTDDTTAAALQEWMAQHPQHKHGGHSYRAEEFGLNPGQIRERFADYCNYFEIREHVA
ncbi:MAG: sulfotransferase [Gammaproteobacteria bacterium]|nr:sulfotransferase [Gammaproteobacteria bacterium]